VTALFAKLHLDSQINVRRGHVQQRIFVSQPMNLSGSEKALGSLLTVEFTHAGYSNPHTQHRATLLSFGSLLPVNGLELSTTRSKKRKYVA
jgi:hypothetical protein